MTDERDGHMTTRELAELLLKEPPDDQVCIAYEGVIASFRLTENRLPDGTRTLLLEEDVDLGNWAKTS